MSLPLKTTADDVRAIVKYLKTKPTGATVTEAKAVSSRIVDGRKVAAYVSWGIVEREDSKLKLADRGQRLARHPDREAEIFREIVGEKIPYRSVTEWAFHQDMDSLDTTDVAAHWHEHHTDAVGEANAKTLGDNAVCFFNIAEAAGLGMMVRGRGGKLTRLDIDRTAAGRFVEAGPSMPTGETPDNAGGDGARGEAAGEDDGRASQASPPAGPNAPSPDHPLRVFISHGSNHAIVEQIEIMLGITEIQAEIAETEETTAIPVPEKVLTAMRRCQAGIIAVTVDEGRKDEDGNYTLNENVLIEIGTAFVLYDRRVVLMWDKRLKVPSNLQGLYRCEFEGEELSWSTGMKLLKAIKDFKEPVDQQ
jgi:CAP12/Pycsar effector protein, TIR domain